MTKALLGTTVWCGAVIGWLCFLAWSNPSVPVIAGSFLGLLLIGVVLVFVLAGLQVQGER